MKATRLALLVSSLCIPLELHAYLGSFEQGDGYELQITEVTTYNAGAFGLNNNGPGGGIDFTPGPRLWSIVSGVNTTNIPNSASPTYATGHQAIPGFVGVLAGTQALVITTNSEGFGGPTLEYAYQLDSRDLDGLNPANTGGKAIDISFWWCPLIAGIDEGGGLGAGTIGDTIQFLDSTGAVGFTLGLFQPGTTTDFVAFDNGSGFINTGIVAFNTGYSRWDISRDLANNTVSADYLDGASNTAYSLLSGAPLAANLIDLTTLKFASTPGVNNLKILALDDFNFAVASSVPEPGTALAGCMMLALCGSSRWGRHARARG